MLLSLAWRNLRRNRRQSALAFGALALAAAILVFTLAVIEGLFAGMVRGATRRFSGDAAVAPAGGSAGLIDDAAPLLERLRAAPGVAGASARLRVPVLLSRGGRRAAVEALGVLPADEARVSRGYGLTPEAAGRAGTTGRWVLLGAPLARRLAAGVGDEVVLATRAADGMPAAAAFVVSGTLETGDPRRDASLALAGLDALRALAGLAGAAHEIGLALADPERAPAAAAQVTALLPAGAGVAVLPWQRRLPALAEAVRFARATSWWLVGLLHAAAGLVAASVLLALAHGRRREHALCIALGMPPALLRGQILAEALLLGAAAVVAGVGAGAAAALLAGARGIELASLAGAVGYAGGTIAPVLHPSLRGADLARVALATLAAAALAGWIPGRRLARLAPAGLLAGREGR